MSQMILICDKVLNRCRWDGFAIRHDATSRRHHSLSVSWGSLWLGFIPSIFLADSFPNGFVPRHLLLRKRRRGKSNLWVIFTFSSNFTFFNFVSTKNGHKFNIIKKRNKMPLPKKVQDLMGPLNLIPHPEGGFFAETFRSGSEPMSTMVSTSSIFLCSTTLCLLVFGADCF